MDKIQNTPETTSGTAEPCGRTPGPWYNDRGRFIVAYKGNRLGLVAEVCAGGSVQPEQAGANASLIAAAPELLQVVRRLIAYSTNRRADDFNDIARAARGVAFRVGGAA